MSELFDEDYFMRGRETGKSLYKDYHWMPELTIDMAKAIIDYLEITSNDKILDFGCARGYTVKALRQLGYMAYGVDVSQWAIENCDPEVRGFVEVSSKVPLDCNWVIAKDVLEHVPDVRSCVRNIMDSARTGVFVVVPLSPSDGRPYVVQSYERDITHLHRFTLQTWADMFFAPGWSVHATYRVPGVKDNYWKEKWYDANGFITAKRIQP